MNGRHIAAFAASKYMYDRLTDIVHRQVLLHLNHVTSVNNIEKTWVMTIRLITNWDKNVSQPTTYSCAY